MSGSELIRRYIDIEKLVKSNPELIQFNKMSTDELGILLESNPSFYTPYLIPLIDTVSRKIIILSYLSNTNDKTVRKMFSLTESEILEINNIQYHSLLRSDFITYFRKEKFDKLSKSIQSEIFLNSPNSFLKKLNFIPKLTIDTLNALSRKYPKFISDYNIDFTDVSTSSYFWIKMIKHNKKYEDIFMYNTKSVTTKSDVRYVIKTFPRLLKKLDNNILQDSKLTVKEWILLSNSVMKSNIKEFKDWSYPSEVKEILKIDLMAEVLSGKSKITKISQNAISNITKEDQLDENIKV